MHFKWRKSDAYVQNNGRKQNYAHNTRPYPNRTLVIWLIGPNTIFYRRVPSFQRVLLVECIWAYVCHVVNQRICLFLIDRVLTNPKVI